MCTGTIKELSEIKALRVELEEKKRQIGRKLKEKSRQIQSVKDNVAKLAVMVSLDTKDSSDIVKTFSKQLSILTKSSPSLREEECTGHAQWWECMDALCV